MAIFKKSNFANESQTKKSSLMKRHVENFVNESGTSEAREEFLSGDSNRKTVPTCLWMFFRQPMKFVVVAPCVAGVTLNDISINITDDVLTVSEKQKFSV